MQYEYEWNHNKARSNLRKHGIQFADAVSIFNNNFAIIISDDHPDEERFIIIGLDFFRRILVIVYSQPAKQAKLNANNMKDKS